MHGDYQFANVMFEHGAPAQLAAIVDWEMGTVGDPKLDLGWVMNSWPDDTSADEDRVGGYVDMTGMPSRPEMLAHYAATSGRQVDDIDYYSVLAKWKLAVVLEQGYQRAGDDEKLQAFGPIVLDLMQARRGPGRVHRLRGDRRRRTPAERRGAALSRHPCAPRCAAPTAGPRWWSWPTCPPRRSDRARSGSASTSGRSTSPTCSSWRTRTRSRCRRRSSSGSEYAGTVVELGEGAEGLALGDRVFGSTIVGAFAEEIVVAPTNLMRIPDGVDDHTAAAFGVAYRTAYHVLRSVAAAPRGRGARRARRRRRRGLGRGAAGRAARRDRHRRGLDAREARGGRGPCGAERLIDHRAGDLRQALREALPGGADVVVDPVGGDLAEPALRALHFGGRFVTVGYASGTIPRIPLNLVLLKGCQILGFQFGDFARHRPEEMARNDRELLDLLVSGRAAPLIGATFSLADAGDALRYVAEGRALGKVVVEVAPGQGAEAPG